MTITVIFFLVVFLQLQATVSVRELDMDRGLVLDQFVWTVS
jgi:hypothetical protein